MSQQIIGSSRLAQRTSAAIANANFSELYAKHLETAVTLTSNGTVVVPAGYAIEHIGFQNTTANAVTGGLKIGTTAGGTEVVTAQAVGANSIDTIRGSDISKRLFNSASATTLYIQAVSAWNSASVNLRIQLRKVF